ncbi:MAG: DNA internalization-related competence protein ComEC/Rec2 [Methylococcales bacterium]|nr:DNA internalization-related competence protein ComEC/Rec2 [Methylococcales bacterium]
MTIPSLTFLLGIVAIQQLPVLPGMASLLLLAAIALIPAYKRQWPWLFFVAGLLWAGGFAMWRMADRLADRDQNRDMLVEGYIASLPQQLDNRISFDFVVTRPQRHFPDKIRLNWYHPSQQLRAGQSWRFGVKLKAPRGLMNPGGFDYETWLFANHIGATGYARNKPPPEAIAPEAGLGRQFAGWRQSIADRLSRALPASEQLGMIKALTIGSQNAISPAQWQVFNTTGTTHLIVISGSHISLIAGLVFLLVRRGWAWLAMLRISPQRMAAVAAWLTALFYAGLAGYSTPTLRAVIMLSVALAAIFWQRHTAALQVLMLALLAVLVFDPFAVLSVGFWLSFAAVALLIYVSVGRLGRGGFWRQASLAQVTTAIGLSPLLIVFFQKVSLISPLANLIAAPIIEIIVAPLALISILLLYIVPSLAAALLSGADLILHGLWRILEMLAALPLINVSCLPPPWYALPVAGVAVLLLLAPRGFPARYLGVFLFLPLFFVSIDKPKPGDLWLTLLDVGQGLSAVAQTAEHTLVFDTGAKYSELSNMGDSVLLPFLRYQGISRLDTLLISHNDNDHSGGAAAVLAGAAVGRIISSAKEWAERSDGEYCRAGQRWEWDAVEFEILSPPESGFAKENNNSCVLRIHNARHSFLLTGDIEEKTETWLVDQFAGELKSTVLVAPHHGSKTSSSSGFLQTVDPELIIIPAGYLNRFGFPHAEVLARYRQLTIPWLNTAEKGAVGIQSEAGDLRIAAERERRRHYWLGADPLPAGEGAAYLPNSGK